MTKCNGHKNRTYWSVSLSIHSDEGLYRTAVYYLARAKRDRSGAERKTDTPRTIAARRLFADLGGRGAKTPEGCYYSLASIRAAIRYIK